MSYTNIAFLFVGSFLVLWSMVRFRGVIAEGVYEFHRGQMVKVDRREQPKVYWAQVAMMFVTTGAGLYLISAGGIAAL